MFRAQLRAMGKLLLILMLSGALADGLSRKDLPLLIDASPSPPSQPAPLDATD